MTSSTLTGDRRWASARRGGMTVLGKVAVPKPINLPSQRLENHGLDPNVEIVPKGTLSWGSRPSSSGSNPWGTSAPSTEGGSSSPSHVVGRPSSGGGTRPSTAGSEKAHDSNTSVWGPNSRPSSASGVMASNHTSLTTLRPCSAETKPGSSHLSRFAEAPPEGSGVWGPTEKMGVATSSKEGFSLSTGDFPTLGSEKDESYKNMESLDHPSHGRPGSSGDTRTMADHGGFTHSDDVSRNSDNRGNTWRKDGPPFVEDGPRPNMERWHSEPHRYPNPNMPPHYESWCGGPPVNPQGGVWFRGPPGPPYGGPIPPCGYPMEPFPFYHPQVPTPNLANSQQIPLGPNHHGPHPTNGDMPRRPHVPHMHPGMPMRPGFYPCPVPYDGFYRPPLGDLPFMGMPPGPPVYGRHPNPSAPDLNNTHPRSREGRGPGLEPGHPHDPHSPYKVPINPNDGWNHKEDEKLGHRMTTNSEKGILSKAPIHENAWGDDYKDEDVRHVKSVNPSSLKFPEHLSNINEAHRNPIIENVPYPQDSSLIQKIEGLNIKARTAIGRQEGFHMDENNNEKVQITNAKDHQSLNGDNSDVVLERHLTGVLVPGTRNSDTPLLDKNLEPGNASLTASPRRSVRGTQSRGDLHAKGKFHGQETDGWGKKIDSQIVSEFGSRSTTNDQVEDQNHNVMSNVDSNDTQRAKMREIAKQRAIQLQKEEEERVREQKAKALAKLEELNRRSANQSAENPNQKETIPPQSDALKKPEFPRNQSEPSVGDGQNTGSNSAPFDNTVNIEEKNTNVTVDSGISSTQIATKQEEETSPQVQEVPRQKRGGYKQRQNVPPEKNITQDVMPFGSVDLQKDIKVTSSTQVVDEKFVRPGVGKEESESTGSTELPVQKKKVNKSGKNKNKVEESSQTLEVTNDPNIHVNAIPDVKEATQSVEIQATQHRDDTQGKENNSWKPQNSRKPRNPQGNRLSDKTHCNDAVMWAPVKSHSKPEVMDQTSQKSAEPLIFGTMGESSVPNSSKTKRAEMERYVPKPVSKDLAQQGSISVDPPQTDKNGGKEKGSQISEVGTNVESKHVDVKIKHQRGQGSWRQRSFVESKGVHTSQDGSAVTIGKNTQTFNGSQWNDTSNKQSEAGQEISVCDGWGDIVDDSSYNTSVVVKDQAHGHAQSGRGKRNLPKGQKGGGSQHRHQNFDRKDSIAGLTEMHSSRVESNQLEMSSKESQPGGDHSGSSHWQPKSHKSRGGQNSVIDENKAFRKESGLDESSAQFAGQGNPSLGHNETKRGRRVPPIKGRPHSNQELETSFGDVEPFSGTRKNPNYNGHFNRGHESRDRAHENKQNYGSGNRERQRQFSHYEYQPVGPYNGSGRSNEGVIQTDDQSGGSRFRERGQGNSRRGRGNSYRRQNGNE